MVSAIATVSLKTSTASFPSKTKISLFYREHKELVEYLDQEVKTRVSCCAAKLFNYFGRWTDWKVPLYNNEWIYQPLMQIYEDLMREHSLHVIREAIALLIRLGFLERRKNLRANNWRNGQDRVYQYRLRKDRLEAALLSFAASKSAESTQTNPFVRSERQKLSSESGSFSVERHTQIHSIDCSTNSLRECVVEKEVEEQEACQEEAPWDLIEQQTIITIEQDIQNLYGLGDEEELSQDQSVIDESHFSAAPVEEELEEEPQEVAESGEQVVCDNVVIEDVWDSQEQPSCHEEPCPAPPKPRKQKKFNARQSKICSAFLLDEPVFIQWWVNRLLKTKFGTEELVLTPQAFVRSSIRRRPEQALDMWDSFQSEMSHRVENYNTRVEHGCQISREEQEQIQAIAPFATPIERVAALPESRPEAPAQLVVALPESRPEAPAQSVVALPESQPEAPAPIEAPLDAENPDAYQEWKSHQEYSPAPSGFFQQMMTRITGKMSMPKAEKVQRRPVVSELERLNADILDPVLRPEVLRRVMASDSYVVDFDEQGVPYQVRRV
jgi:hypothetical protein